jgi:hypothetical protein
VKAIDGFDAYGDYTAYVESHSGGGWARRRSG